MADHCPNPNQPSRHLSQLPKFGPSASCRALPCHATRLSELCRSPLIVLCNSMGLAKGLAIHRHSDTRQIHHTTCTQLSYRILSVSVSHAEVGLLLVVDPVVTTCTTTVGPDDDEYTRTWPTTTARETGVPLRSDSRGNGMTPGWIGPNRAI